MDTREAVSELRVLQTYVRVRRTVAPWAVVMSLVVNVMIVV